MLAYINKNRWRHIFETGAISLCRNVNNHPDIGSNTPQGANYTGTNHLSRKLYKLDEPEMPDTAGEARTRL